ncbi:Mu transposase C-terminal domain-containing protein [Sinomonas albida]|uniref:Mu transposase C-terminal domain-containing protein n=1 Tax=Sinomonas albida TaxID=369942 RepID=UPI0010A900A5|nr:Mu transposase C-terminal domain-containing protein [Sinomonas albida]
MAGLSDREKAELVHRHRDGVPWVRLAEDAGVTVRTLQRWAGRAEGGGLARPSRGDKGTKRTPSELVEAVEALALGRPAPTAAYIHRRVGDIARSRGLSAPGYTTVRDIIKGIDPGLRTLAAEGGAAYRDRFELVFRRTAAAPNEQWQMDHTLLDVVILDEQQQAVRPWLTVALDDYSRAVAGYSLSVQAPTAEHSALAFHQAVSRKHDPAWVVSGLPDVLYSDHGSDFTSARLEQVCLDLHIRLVHSHAGRPQGRGKIERFYRTLTTELLPHLPGFIPHGTGGKPLSEPSLTIRQLDEILERFIVHEYNERSHSETKAAPHARWRGTGFVPRSPAHPEDIDLLLLTAATTRRVQRDGIQFASTRYISPVLAAYVGEDVTVRYDPRDLGEIRVFHENAFLCRAIAPERSSETYTFADLQAARTARRRALKKQLKERRSLADSLPADGRHQLIPTAQPEPDCELDPTPDETRKHGLKTYASE